MSDAFTDLFIRSLKPAGKEYTRRERGGFGVRVYPTGRKTFFYLYRVDGNRRLLNLGEYYDPKRKGETKGDRITLQEAREIYDSERVKVKDLKSGRATGQDPVILRKQQSEQRRNTWLERKRTPTVADFISKEYIEKYLKPKVKRWEEVARSLEYDVVPAWGKRKITDITRRDIILLRDKIAERGAPVQSNRVLAYVSGMFSFAVDQHAVEKSPYSNIRRATKEKPKERELSEAEIKQLWLALDDTVLLMSKETRTALKLILLTAQRPGEVVGMHFDEIDGHWWTIPGSKTKNEKTHRVHLSDTALDLIAGLERDKGYVFPAGRGNDGCMTVNALSFALRRNIKGHAVKSDKVKRRKGEAYKRGPYKTDKPLLENPNRIGIEIFGAHDLRRTATGLMAKEKIPFEIRERVLNHTMGKLDDTYNRYDYDAEKQMAMEALERKIISIASGKGAGKVVSIATATGKAKSLSQRKFGSRT
ncbi:MAG TPA: integrase arm-type DNA-binding domain-containing protein [Geobacteraceae bacterium]|nr:integrase arm-type DNA-binding domain-containing protein [Geobacteraceae bacterium]